MGEPESTAEPPHDDRSQPTIVLRTEVFDFEVDPVLELLNRWEEYRLRGEEPPAGWPAAVDPALRDELHRRIRRRKRLIELLELTDPKLAPSPGREAPLPAFPGHETLGRIGRGGMGAVYRARDTELDRIVAIKTIAEGRHATPDQRERFRAEARAIARLHHPNIIGIHAIGEHEGQPYLVLEYAAGGSLAGRLAEKPMTPREAAPLLETLARAVHAAHQAGVVHRDLKPSNILLTAEGIPRVSDFGLAKLMDADGCRTITGQVLGSPSFMAPEQVEGRAREVGPPADVYSLGSILYQALTGRPPFLGESHIPPPRTREPCRSCPDRFPLQA